MKGRSVKRVRWLVLFVICGLIFYFYRVGNQRIDQQIQELTAQESMYRLQLVRVQKESKAMEEELKQVGTDAYIENKARTQYGFLKPGEIRFEITNPEALYGAQQVNVTVAEQGE